MKEANKFPWMLLASAGYTIVLSTIAFTPPAHCHTELTYQSSRLAASPSRRHCCFAVTSTTGSCRLAMAVRLSASEYKGMEMNCVAKSCIGFGTQANAMGGIRWLMGDSDVRGLILLPSKLAPWSVTFDSKRHGDPCKTYCHWCCYYYTIGNVHTTMRSVCTQEVVAE